MFQSPVLRVFTTSLESCFDLPWQSQRPQSGTGSGVYMGEQLILTGAHVVNDATFIQVQKLSSAQRVVAQLKSICHDADLALLWVDDQEFFDDLEAAKLGELPELKDKVEVVGFPTGGEQVSVTNGVVSRLEVTGYSYSWRNLLGATIDAAINPGNSGGPVFNQVGEVVGIAFQKNVKSENSGQMIPPPVIANFMSEAQKGSKVVSIPMLGIVTQKLENPALKKHFQVPSTFDGVLVTAVDFDSPAYGHLKVGDVLHRINQYDISSLGTIHYLDRYRTRFSAVLSECVENDQIKILRRRNGELLEVNISLHSYRPLADSGEGILNRYFIYAGLVFQPLTRKYLQTWKSARHAPTALQHAYRQGNKSEEKREILVLSHVLADDVNIGYSDFNYQIITEINGTEIRDLNHLVHVIEAKPELLEFKTASQQWLIIDQSHAQERHQVILDRYQIGSDRLLN